MSRENVELVKGIYARWRRGDFSATDWAHPDIDFRIPGPHPEVRGVDEMNRSWLGWLEAYTELSVEAKATYDEGDVVVVEQEFHGEGRGSGIPVDEIAGACVFTIRQGKVVRFRGFTNLEEALADAGIEKD